MSPEVEIKVIKSPISRAPMPDRGSVRDVHRLVYYVKLSNGLIAASPEDFENDTQKRKEK
jgi:hypothetical protein